MNFPKALAEIRLESYRRNAWPAPLAFAFRRNGLLVSLILGVTLAAALSFKARPADNADSYAADFYKVVPHDLMVAVYGGISVLVLAGLAIGLRRFWRDSGGGRVGFAALRGSFDDALRLRYLASGGVGCTYPDQRHSQLRRWFHHFTFYGFALCFAATSVAAFYHYAFHWLAPYGYFSLPVLLGTAGGAGLLIGPAGLLSLRIRRDRALGDARQNGLDLAFLVLLLATSLTGLLLLALRSTPAMPLLLAIHLAVVLAFFLTLPYGKFVHGMYRWAALLRNANEKNRSDIS